MTINWRATDAITINVRANDRRSKWNGNGGSDGALVLSEGPGAIPFRHPIGFELSYSFGAI